LISKVSPPDWRVKPYPVNGGKNLVSPTRLQPSDIDIERILGLDKPPREIFEGKRINPLGCVYSEAWTEAIIGCPIYASQVSCSSKPIALPTQQAVETFSIDQAKGSDWTQVLEALVDRTVQAAGQTRPVRQPHLRGIVDMLAAYLGEEEMCLALVDQPAQIERLASQFAELYIILAKRFLKSRPCWMDGYVSSWGMYAPGELLDYQADASSILSPAIYDQHFKKYDAQVLRAFPYQVMHTHSCGLHILEPILQIDELLTVQISLDREANVWEPQEIVDSVEKIQQRGKRALITGELTDEELRGLLRQLDPRGLAVFYWNPAGGRNWPSICLTPSLGLAV
jgi:hypothetical protein